MDALDVVDAERPGAGTIRLWYAEDPGGGTHPIEGHAYTRDDPVPGTWRLWLISDHHVMVNQEVVVHLGLEGTGGGAPDWEPCTAAS